MILSKNLFRSVSYRVQEKCLGVLGTVYLPVSTARLQHICSTPMFWSDERWMSYRVLPKRFCFYSAYMHPPDISLPPQTPYEVIYKPRDLTWAWNGYPKFIAFLNFRNFFCNKRSHYLFHWLTFGILIRYTCSVNKILLLISQKLTPTAI